MNTSTPNMKHHRFVVTQHGGPEVLQLVEEELPEPQAGEVRVKVQAAGVSAYDLMFHAQPVPLYVWVLLDFAG